MTTRDHAALIEDQFTRQATPFAEFIVAPGAAIVERLVDAACGDGGGTGSDVLDVACGPGVVACALARRARSVRGLDVVPAMLAEAKRRAERESLENVTFDEGDATRLPYEDGRFDAVVSRYAFHHLVAPEVTLREMVRVAKPGATIVVCDVALPCTKRDAYDAAERVRDPSHTQALELESIEALFASAGLAPSRVEAYALEAELETVIASSFPDEGGAERLRAIYRADVGVDALGMNVHERDGAIRFHYPTAMIVARK